MKETGCLEKLRYDFTVIFFQRSVVMDPCMLLHFRGNIASLVQASQTTNIMSAGPGV